MQSNHPWKARFTVGLLMLALGFLGVVLTDIRTTGGWDYWKWVVPLYALLTLWLSWYGKKQSQVISPISIGHEILHWVGLILAVFLVSYLVHLGTFSRFMAGIMNLLLLSLSVFIAGAYLDPIFLFSRICSGDFCTPDSAFGAIHVCHCDSNRARRCGHPCSLSLVFPPQAKIQRLSISVNNGWK